MTLCVVNIDISWISNLSLRHGPSRGMSTSPRVRQWGKQGFLGKIS